MYSFSCKYVHTGWLKSWLVLPRNRTTSSKFFSQGEHMQSYKLFCQLILCLNFFNMEKIEYRAVIRFFVSKGFKAKEIYEQLLEVYKEFSPSKRTVKFWAGEFKRSRTRLL